MKPLTRKLGYCIDKRCGKYHGKNRQALCSQCLTMGPPIASFDAERDLASQQSTYLEPESSYSLMED